MGGGKYSFTYAIVRPNGSWSFSDDLSGVPMIESPEQIERDMDDDSMEITAALQHIKFIHVQYSDIMRFLVRHNRHHKVSQSVPLFKSRKTVTISLRIKVEGHFVMSIVTCHESHYVGVLDNPHQICD